MPDAAALVAALSAQRLLPVLREPSVEAAVAKVEALGAAGCGVIELTTSTPEWVTALRTASARPGPDGQRLTVGMGTVSTADQARKAIEAGAAFLVSPYPAPAVRAVADEAGTIFIEGGYTPGEVAAAAAHGPAKVFPAHVGGPQFLKSVLAVLPGAVLIPTGGIGVDDAPAYLAAGAVAVGVGSSLPVDPDELRRLFASGTER
jgi:2-dehydro-3-deoxyphosphogluconate aldolase / (4S)-4-hydroxy-2-oxoglutarate aldolase